MRKNVVLNVLGGGAVALLTLMLIPVQIRQLGIEAYGLIGLLASLQVFLSLFDLGLSPAMTWQVARTGADPVGVVGRALVLIFSAYSVLGLILGAVLFLAAPWIAMEWLRLAALPVDVATSALRFGAIAIAVRWPVSLFAGLLAGLQRFDVLSMLRAGHAVISFVGGVLVLTMFPAITAFAMWLAVSALVEVTVYAIASGFLVLRKQNHAGRVQEEVATIWSYARSIAIINVLSLVLTQSDRLLLSRFAQAADLGRYALTYNLFFGLTLIQLFITAAIYPSFTADFASCNQSRIISRYRDATRTISFLYSFPFAFLVILGQTVLVFVVPAESVGSTAVILSVIGFGFLFNAATALPYTVALAAGRPRLPVVINTANVVWYLPVLLLAIILFGPLGAAVAWACLNASYLLTLIPEVHRGILGAPKIAWLLSDFMRFPLIAVACFATARMLFGMPSVDNALPWVGIVAAGFVALLMEFRLLSPSLRSHARALIPFRIPLP